jgi:phage-related protein
MLPTGLKFTVCWAVEGNDCPTLLYLEELFQTDEDCGYVVVDYMEKIQDSEYLRPPTVKKIPINKSVKDLYELKIHSGSSGIFARIALIYTPDRKIILLNGISKKTNKASKQFINRAIKIRARIKNKEMEYEQIDFKAIREAYE